MSIDSIIKILFYLTVGLLYIFYSSLGKKFYLVVGLVYISYTGYNLYMSMNKSVKNNKKLKN